VAPYSACLDVLKRLAVILRRNVRQIRKNAMTGRIWIIAALAIIGLAASARAQEYWLTSGGGYKQQLRYACENGDEEACWRLQQMHNQRQQRQEWREQNEQGEDE
jgi:hypothetical protein